MSFHVTVQSGNNAAAFPVRFTFWHVYLAAPDGGLSYRTDNVSQFHATKRSETYVRVKLLMLISVQRPSGEQESEATICLASVDEVPEMLRKARNVNDVKPGRRALKTYLLNQTSWMNVFEGNSEQVDASVM